MTYNYDRLLKEVPNEESAIDFFRRVLLHQQRGHEVRSGTVMHSDSCKSTESPRIETLFNPSSKLPFQTILKFAYWWAREEEASIQFLESELKIDDNTVNDLNMYMREVCAYCLLQRQGQIGGTGQTVEIDEALFTKQRKNNCGKVLPEQWVFGGICRETREVFMVTAPDRTANTLMAVINDKIAHGTIIMSDCWRAYNMVIVKVQPLNYLKLNVYIL